MLVKESADFIQHLIEEEYNALFKTSRKPRKSKEKIFLFVFANDTHQQQSAFDWLHEEPSRLQYFAAFNRQPPPGRLLRLY